MSGSAKKKPRNILIAIKSCERDVLAGFNQVMRETWLENGIFLNVDVKFFVGHGKTELLRLQADEERVNCRDEYLDLPDKVRAILLWAILPYASTIVYDYIFLCDTDTYVVPERLLASGFEDYDYIGNFNGELGKSNAVEGAHYAWASGGDGYWLSRKAAAKVAFAPEPTDWAEDKITGQLLGPLIASGEIKAKDDKRYADFPRNTDPATGDWKVDISLHYCCHGMGRAYDPAWMPAVHRRVMAERA